MGVCVCTYRYLYVLVRSCQWKWNQVATKSVSLNELVIKTTPSALLANFVLPESHFFSGLAPEHQNQTQWKGEQVQNTEWNTIKSNFQIRRVKLKCLTSHMWPPGSRLATPAEKIWSPSDFRERAVRQAQQTNDRQQSSLSCWRLSWKSHGPFRHSEDHFPSRPVGGHQADTPPPPNQPLATTPVLHSVEQLMAPSQAVSRHFSPSRWASSNEASFSNDPKRYV